MKTIAISGSPKSLLRVLPLIAAMALAGCAENSTSAYTGPILSNAPMDATVTEQPQLPTGPSPAQATATGLANIDVTNFIDPAAFKLMGDASRTEAANAQFYALQFGRVGAARNWNGDSGQSGSVNVGPYVKVNNRDCRDFTDIVNVGAKSYPRRGTACREDDGRWSVAAQGAASAQPAVTPPAAASGVGASG